MPSLRWIIGAAAVVLMALIIGTICFFEFQRITRLDSAIIEQERILAEKKESVRNYREMVAFYKTREGVEHLAREQYNLAFPGERVIIIVSEDQVSKPSR